MSSASTTGENTPTHGEPLENGIALRPIKSANAHEVLIALDAISWAEDGRATASAPISNSLFYGADIKAINTVC